MVICRLSTPPPATVSAAACAAVSWSGCGRQNGLAVAASEGTHAWAWPLTIQPPTVPSGSAATNVSAESVSIGHGPFWPPPTGAPPWPPTGPPGFSGPLARSQACVSWSCAEAFRSARRNSVVVRPITPLTTASITVVLTSNRVRSDQVDQRRTQPYLTGPAPSRPPA